MMSASTPTNIDQELPLFRAILLIDDNCVFSDGTRNEKDEATAAFEQSIIDGTFRIMSKTIRIRSDEEKGKYKLEEDPTVTLIGNTISSAIPLLFKVAFRNTDATNFLGMRTYDLDYGTQMIDHLCVYPQEDGVEDTPANRAECEVRGCTESNCQSTSPDQSISPSRFIRVVPNSEDWTCTECVDKSHLLTLKFLLNSVTPGDGFLYWYLTEPEYSQKETELFGLRSDEMWFTIPSHSVPSNINQIMSWTQLRFIMKRPSNHKTI
jgi:hypothetical protein